MGNLVLLATEAHGEGGFGLNFNILETNLINLSILLGVLYYFGRQLVGNVLSERRSKIEQAIKEVEARQRQGAEALADQQQKLAQAQVEAENIRAAAEVNAKAAKEAILAASAQEIERMKESAVQDLNSERERAMAELRQRVATMAMAKVDSQLRDTLDNSAQQQLIDRNIALLGGGS
ncbi:MAG: F0F1 ATP synthase subunit B [Moorea sp. SIOASIH]|uniref:F0F1 ATP synthase subunit B n=1 Tax=Moorena sp. SIOASIH TaxID=2607817 RepID=UPI0013BAA377|nr:F0F1 ATP synthase subunit B [Moorena sp. SIOASIH]NEO42312.1 F0F1 ATP synthase subunit B [Moorena sp. SIOASIH]